MYVDAVTTAAVADELNRLVVGGRVQDVIEVDDRSIGLEIYAGGRHYLLMTVDPQAARVHLVPDRLRRGRRKPSPLGQLLDKYVDGARLQAVTQPPWERILHLDFSGHAGETRLIAETMDRRSNLILTVERDARTPEQLRGQLLALVAERGGEFGIVVRRIGNPFFLAPENQRNRRLFGNRDKTVVGPIVAAYKVYPDGREVLLRSVVVANVNAQGFREILAAGNQRRVVHRPFRPASGNRFAFGAASSEIPLISLVTPALLFEELTLSDAGGEDLQPMVVKPPRQGAGEKTSPGLYLSPPRYPILYTMQ